MAKDPKLLLFVEAKEDALENIEAMRLALARSVEDEMPNMDPIFYEQLAEIEDAIDAVEDWEELTALIGEAKTLEINMPHGSLSMDGQAFPFPGQKNRTRTWSEYKFYRSPINCYKQLSILGM